MYHEVLTFRSKPNKNIDMQFLYSQVHSEEESIICSHRAINGKFLHVQSNINDKVLTSDIIQKLNHK